MQKASRHMNCFIMVKHTLARSKISAKFFNIKNFKLSSIKIIYINDLIIKFVLSDFCLEDVVDG